MYSVTFGTTVIPCEDFHLESLFWNGATRSIVVFTFNPNATSVDTLNTIVSEKTNTKSITIDVVDDDSPQLVKELENYIFKMSISIESNPIVNDIPDAPVEFYDKIILRLACCTYVEQYIINSDRIVNIITEGE